MGKKKNALPPGFVYNRQPPARWVEMLAELAPETPHRAWLLLAWMSGDPWSIKNEQTGQMESQVVQRWVVYEMVPLRVWWGIIQGHRRMGKSDSEIMELDILEALSGPHPRDLGHFDEVLDRYITDAEVTKQEWELFRQYKAIPKLFWIIQGPLGGHKRAFTPLERKYLQQAGLPEEPPNPGDLPYAEFDQRTLMQLARRDRLHKLSDRLSPIESERDAQLVEFRRQLVGWLEDQMRERLESVKLDLSGIPTSGAKEDDPTGMIEEKIDRYIQTGSTEPGPEES